MKKIKAKCLRKERHHCIACPDFKKCKVKEGGWRGYYYGLDKMKVVMPEDLEDFLKHEFRPVPLVLKKKEKKRANNYF